MSWISLVLFKKEPNQHLSTSQGGFGLIELIVSIGIMVFILSMVLVKQGSFDNAILLRSQAYEIALMLREIQLSAVSSINDGSGDFRADLGVSFNKTTAIDRGVYKIFRDLNNNGYDSGEEYGIQGVLDNRFEIRDIIVGTNNEDKVSIVFTRPNFDAMFYDALNALSTEAVVLIVIGKKGAVSPTRTVEISATGQISVL